MIQVQIVRGDTSLPFGPPVEDLSAARTVVKLLDWMFETGRLPTFPFEFYTPDCEVIAFDIDDPNQAWDYMDQDPTGASDGVWFPR